MLELINGKNQIEANTDDILTEMIHVSAVFPADTDETVTLTAHANANTWSAYTELADNDGVKLSTILGTSRGHLSDLVIENASVVDKAYMIEISYGDDHTVIATVRIISGSLVLLPPIQQMRIRSNHIPASTEIYYRCKCETGAGTMQVHLRYHAHA